MSDVLKEYEAVIHEAYKPNRGYESARDDDRQDAIRDLAVVVLTQRETIRELQERVAELDAQVKRWEDLFAVTEEAAEDCRTGVPLLTHEQVFGVAAIASDTDGLPKGGQYAE